MSLESVKKSDVLIIGAGVIGLSLARELHKKGFGRVTIIEKGSVGREASYAAAGMLAAQAEGGRADDFFHFCRESAGIYPQFAEELLDETDVDIELDREGTLYLAFTEADVEELARRFEWQTGAGLTVERLSAVETHKLEPFVSPDVLGSLYFPDDWQVENRRLLYALEKYCRRFGIEIIENAGVKALLLENEKVVGAETAGGKFFADRVVLATGAWTSLIKAGKLTLPEVKPIRGQIIEYHTAKRLFHKVIYSPRGYLVPRRNGRILAGATAADTGFDKTVLKEETGVLRENALEIAPSLINLDIHDQWVGLRPLAADALPVIGAIEEAENLYVAGGHYRNGILLAPLTAKVLAEHLAGENNSPYLDAFGPRRRRLNAAEA